VELVVADLVDPAPWGEILDGVDAVVLSANPVAPRKGDDPAAVDAAVERLVGRIADRGGIRVVLPSVGTTSADSVVPLAGHRRRVEDRLPAGGGHVVLRLPPFMEAWLGLVGCRIPMRGEAQATLARPSPMLRSYMRAVGGMVEHGVMLVPGSVAHRHAFIAIADVARAVAAAVAVPDPPAQPREVGGPEVLSWTDVAAIYSRVLDRKVHAVGAPGGLFAFMARGLGELAPVPARTMALNHFMAMSEHVYPAGGGLVDPATMTTVAEFLRNKASLPHEVPVVV
jgi:uncharacterized protein YbjT (DUF2867 family)